MPKKNSANKGMNEVVDLRSAIRLLEETPGQLIKTDKPVDPHAELAGVYKPIGAGTPSIPPTSSGPAMLFNIPAKLVKVSSKLNTVDIV